MDELPDQLSIGEDERLEQLPPLPSGLSPFVISGYRSDDQLWLEVNFSQLFKELSEQAIISAAWVASFTTHVMFNFGGLNHQF